MVKKGNTGDTVEAPESALTLPCTNGSQLALYPWMRELDGNTECFEADEAYFLTTGSWVNNAGKAVYVSPQHAVLARSGFIAKEKYGIFKPLPTDGFLGLYAQKLSEVAAGAAIPRPLAISALPDSPAMTDITDNQLVAPDKLAMIDLKIKGTLLRLISSSGRRRHYMEAVGPSGVELLKKLNSESQLSESVYSQSHHSRQIKAQLGEAYLVPITSVSILAIKSFKRGLQAWS